MWKLRRAPRGRRTRYWIKRFKEAEVMLLWAPGLSSQTEKRWGIWNTTALEKQIWGLSFFSLLNISSKKPELPICTPEAKHLPLICSKAAPAAGIMLTTPGRSKLNHHHLISPLHPPSYPPFLIMQKGNRQLREGCSESFPSLLPPTHSQNRERLALLQESCGTGLDR